MADTDRRQGTYCSKACKYQALKSIRPPWAKPEEKTRHSAGYVLVWKPDHPRAHGGRVFEHILVMEEHLGRPLADGEFVHHEDGCRTNNAASNLRVVTNPEHGTIHARTNPYCQPRDRRTLSCQECGIEFEVQRHKAEPKDSADRRKYCSLACRHRSWGRQMKAKREAKKETNHASH